MTGIYCYNISSNNSDRNNNNLGKQRRWEMKKKIAKFLPWVRLSVCVSVFLPACLTLSSLICTLYFIFLLLPFSLPLSLSLSLDTRSQFWPPGIVVACVCLCVCLCVNHELVCAITHHPFKLRPPNLDQRLRSLLFLGLSELDMADFTYFQNPVYLHRYCVFEIFVRPEKNIKTESVPHPKWLRTYLFAHSVVSRTVEQSSCIFSVTIADFPVLDSAIGKWIFNNCVGFCQVIHTSHAEILYSNNR